MLHLLRSSALSLALAAATAVAISLPESAAAVDPTPAPAPSPLVQEAYPDPALMTNAVTSGAFDFANGLVYGATRTATPASLFVSDLAGTPVTSAKLPRGTGSWDMALSGSTLAIGTTSTGTSTWLLGFDTATRAFTKTITLPGANMVTAVIEDTWGAAPGNGRYFWVGTYSNRGARLFRADLSTGTAVDYTPGTQWSGVYYVRALTADRGGVTIGLGNPAAVWRLGALTGAGSVPIAFGTANVPLRKASSFVYSAATLVPADPASHSTAVLGTENGASLVLLDPQAGANASPRTIPLPAGRTVDRIAVDQTRRTAWFTLRPAGALYSLDLANPSAAPTPVTVPIEDAETRALTVDQNGRVWGITGTSDVWYRDPGAAAATVAGRIIRPADERADTTQMGVVSFLGRALVAGHWRYQVHGDSGGVTTIETPGEPKAQVVVGNTMYAAIYPSAKVVSIDSSLGVTPLTAIGNGQMRPGAMAYSDALKRLAVATGPAYGLYGGALSIIDPATASTQVYTRPVDDQIVSAMAPLGGDFVIGTQTAGEAAPDKPGALAQLRLWRPAGDGTTGTTVWSRTVPVPAQRITGVTLVADETGSFVLATARNTSAGTGWIIALDASTGAVLWSKATGPAPTQLTQADGYITALIGGSAVQLGATRSDLAISPLRAMPANLSWTYASTDTGTGGADTRRLAYVVTGGTGVVGYIDQGVPRVPYRISGAERSLTAVAVSRQAFTKASTVVLARGDDFADALAAGPLAAAMQAPVLLTRNGTVTPETSAEIARLGATDVVLVGGPGAIPDTVKNALPAAARGNVTRLSGKTRYETSVAVAKRLQQVLGVSTVPVLATTGLGFADAVSAVPAAVAAKRAIVLVDRSRTSAASLEFIEGRDVAALGGPAVDALAAAKVKVSASIVGSDRYQTAALIAARYLPGSKRAYLASGVSFPDGLTAGVLAARQSAPILLAPADALPAATTAALTAGAGSQRVYLVGGTGVLGSALEPAIAAVP
ncbi:cell wall-binding repeat-containing protein [uncultured Leifsonia sp.]|uniref:cell wall-binding repeat-containing protein n=1 Tax=uncultured Leifsonia sp. TaxID=340359 RepID=UPI0028D5B585|nr:cell wall-binding repeat-containing protein [uncultured Leifsonia sp.]